MMGKLLGAAVMVGGMLLCHGFPANAADLRLIEIGTGGTSGVYYPTGGAICEMVNRDRMDHGVRCVAQDTSGSIANLERLRSGSLDFALVQSDVQFQAVHGSGVFAGTRPDKSLRAVFSLYQEAFTIVARRASDIHQFEDLKGKRVNIGNPGSGQRSTMEAVMTAIGWTLDSFSAVSELSSSDQARALCAGEIDAAVFIVGHPNRSIADATADCDSVLVPVATATIDKLLAENSYYSHALIPGGSYPGNPEDVKTFGVTATFVTTSQEEVALVEHVVAAVFGQFEEFRSLHPSLASLDKSHMITEGLSAPLHYGALRYYRQNGLIDRMF